jgi:hypothetical protein
MQTKETYLEKINDCHIVADSLYSLELLKDLSHALPHGSGIDTDWHLSHDEDKDVFSASNSYHVMSEYGMYLGYIAFEATILQTHKGWYLDSLTMEDGDAIDDDDLRDAVYGLAEYLEDTIGLSLDMYNSSMRDANKDLTRAMLDHGYHALGDVNPVDHDGVFIKHLDGLEFHIIDCNNLGDNRDRTDDDLLIRIGSLDLSTLRREYLDAAIAGLDKAPAFPLYLALEVYHYWGLDIESQHITHRSNVVRLAQYHTR